MNHLYETQGRAGSLVRCPGCLLPVKSLARVGPVGCGGCYSAYAREVTDTVNLEQRRAQLYEGGVAARSAWFKLHIKEFTREDGSPTGVLRKCPCCFKETGSFVAACGPCYQKYRDDADFPTLFYNAESTLAVRIWFYEKGCVERCLSVGETSSAKRVQMPPFEVCTPENTSSVKIDPKTGRVVGVLGPQRRFSYEVLLFVSDIQIRELVAEKSEGRATERLRILRTAWKLDAFGVKTRAKAQAEAIRAAKIELLSYDLNSDELES